MQMFDSRFMKAIMKKAGNFFSQTAHLSLIKIPTLNPLASPQHLSRKERRQRIGKRKSHR
jgi:hypothetical protein